MFYLQNTLASLFISFFTIDHSLPPLNDIDIVRMESKAFSKALQNEELTKVLGYFDSDTMVLPEYHPALENTAEIEAYYREFFKRSETKKLSRQVMEVLRFGDYFQELGTFEHTFRIQDKTWFTYEAKYSTWWKKTKKERFKVLAHIWGGNRWYEPEKLNFVQVSTQERKPLLPKTLLEKQICEQIEATIQIVKEGNSEKQIEGYLEDAIYMTYYDPPFIGKKAIADYFRSHNDPKVVRDSLIIRPYRVIAMGDYSLQLNKYYVKWTYEGNTSYIYGKGLNLRKRLKNGNLKMYRQILNHDIPPTPLEKTD